MKPTKRESIQVFPRSQLQAPDQASRGWKGPKSHGYSRPSTSVLLLSEATQPASLDSRQKSRLNLVSALLSTNASHGCALQSPELQTLHCHSAIARLTTSRLEREQRGCIQTPGFFWPFGEGGSRCKESVTPTNGTGITLTPSNYST
jgi:hypothetical protein